MREFGKKYNLFRRGIFYQGTTRLVQTINRRLNSAYLEGLYQTSYLDMARRAEWLTRIPMASPNGGTASFSLLYVLLSILQNRVVSHLMELGVGQSTILCAQYARTFQRELTLIDDNLEWLQFVQNNAAISHEDGIFAIYAKLKKISAVEKVIDWYDCEQPTKKFDFLLIDGPPAYLRRIQYNRLGIMNWLPGIMSEEFIIVIDDSNRKGEQLLVNSIMHIFQRKGIEVGKREIVGANSQTVIATPKFREHLYL